MNPSERTGRLQDSELGEVVRRAQEIQDQTHLMLDPHPDLEQYIQAAEEAGIDRAATMQALRERLTFPIEKFKEGEYVFAKSADGHYYVAILEELDGRQAKVQFLSGMDHHCDATDLRLFSLTPGQKVSYHSKNTGMWWEGQLIKFNREKEQVTVSSWGDTESVPLHKVRMPKDVEQIPLTMRARLWTIGIASALGGGVIGAIVMRLLMR